MPGVLCCAVVTAALLGFANLSQAEPTRDALLTAEPIAECEVALKKQEQEPEEMPLNVVNFIQSRPELGVLDFYAREHDGQWSIPTEVRREDPWVRLLVMGPTKPVVVDLAVYIDGETFREKRERWIDDLVKQATAPPNQQEKSAAEEETDEPAEEAEPVKESSEESEDENEAEIDLGPRVKVQSRRAPSAVDRLRQYLSAGVESTDREEIRWLLAEWAGGPGLLTLGPAVSWKRAEVAPLWNWLDNDHDRILSTAEIENAPLRLQQADVNQDDIVEIEELEQAQSKASPYARSMSHPLVMPLNEATTWKVLRSQLIRLYGNSSSAAFADQPLKNRIAAGDRTLTDDDLQGLLQVAADVVCRFELTHEGGKISLMANHAAADEQSQTVWSDEQRISVDRGGMYLELTAMTVAQEQAMAQNQTAIGAVVDGYPLFRLLDQDNNRRLTLREGRQLAGLLSDLDLNKDKQITSEEIPTAVRIAVTRGPIAHEVLSSPIAAAERSRSIDLAEAPSWFVNMDRNGDGDLTRKEFLGNSDRFQLLDQDGDKLISAKEAQDFSRDNE